MKRFFLYSLSILLGLIAGAIGGVILGIIITTIAQTSQFEGKAGYVVFLTFMPLGALVGVFAAPWWLAVRLKRKDDAALAEAKDLVGPGDNR